MAISAILPSSKISLVAGIMEAFSQFLHNYHMIFLTPIISVLITIGAIGSVNTWIVGPSKGLMWTSHDGDIPPLFQWVNKHHMPIPILLVQGAIVTLLALLFLLMPTLSGVMISYVFWPLSTPSW